MTTPQVIAQIVLPITLAVMMFAMGLSLTLSDFKRIGVFPKAAITGIMMQLLLLPLIAWTLILLFESFTTIPVTLSFGLLILASCPGGATSNVISHLAGGDGALSISMTAVVSLLMPFLVPVSLSYQLSWLGGDAFNIELPVLKTIMQLIIITVFPVLLAMILRHHFPGKVMALEPAFKKVSGSIFIALVIALTISQWPQLKSLGVEVVILCLSLCLLAMLAAYLTAKSQGFDIPTRKTLTIEVGIQNSGTGMFIAAVLLNSHELALISLLYGLLMNIPAFTLIAINYVKTTDVC